MSLARIIGDRLGQRTAPGGQVVDCVRETVDFRRVRDLPRREWTEEPTLDRLVAALTAALKTTHGAEELRPIQAATLSELHDMRGAFVTARVGAGKTLIGALAASDLVLGSKRPLYVTRGGVVGATRKALYDASVHWKIPPLNLTSYSKLALDYENKILGEYQPDLIIADESDALASTRSGCWQIIGKYIHAVRAKERAEKLPFGTLLVFLPMCGTPADSSINQYHHIVHAALGPDRSPVPKDWREKNEWCQALDHGVRPENRLHPGALPRLDPTASGISELDRARNAFGSRFRSTPGVMTTGDVRPENKLHITAVELDASPEIATMVTRMREDYCTPDGHPFEMAMELWRHCRELQADFYNIWDPRPPTDWLAVRKEWHQIRNENYGPRSAYRTPGHLVQAILAGEERDPDLVAAWYAWKEMEPTFTPNPVPVYVESGLTAEACAHWLENSNGGLLWVEFPALGKRVAEFTGIPFYHQLGLNADGQSLEDHKRGYPAIASVRGCSYGLNLQRIFYRNFYATPMSTGKAWEQSLGRTHRDGQPAPIVTAEVGMMVYESYSSMLNAVRKAEMVSATIQQCQKLVYADVRDFGQIQGLIERRENAMWETIEAV